jgi:hypothetical protein
MMKASKSLFTSREMAAIHLARTIFGYTHRRQACCFMLLAGQAAG